MAIKPSNVEKPKSKIEPFLPVLLTFGPVFLWMGLQNGTQDSIKNTNSLLFWLTHGESIVGLFMLVFGLVILKLKQDSLEKRLDALERLEN